MNKSALKEPVIPQGKPITGISSEFTKSPLELYLKTHKKYGDYIKYQFLPGLYVYGLYHPDAVQHILQKKQANYRKPDFFYKSTGFLLGKGLFTSEGEYWLKQRKLIQPAFNRKKIEVLTNVMVKAISDSISEWKNFTDGQIIDISEEMMKITLRILSRALFSIDISDNANDLSISLRNGLEFISYKMNNMLSLPLWFPNERNKTFIKSRDKMDEIVLNIITIRRNENKEHNDLLDLLIKAKDEESGSIMTDQELKDEIMTILIAGHDTVAAALAWTFYLLDNNHDKKSNLLDEINSVLGNRQPDFSDLDKLKYTKMVFEESMRLYPPAWGLPREAIQDDEIEGYYIKKGLPIALSQYVTHRHPEFWEKPLEFYPEHFENDKIEKRHKFAYFPFGGGTRMCIGNYFAMLEAQLVLASFAQRFDFKLIKDQEIIPDPTFTLIAKNGIKGTIHKRK